MMQTITRSTLRDMLFNQRGATFVTMTARTVPVLVGGKKCPLAGLTKVSVINGTINWSYQNAVNAQRLREGTPTDENDVVEHFVPHPRSWGVRLHEALAERSKARLLPLVAKNWNSSEITAEELATLPVEELYLEFKAGKSIEYKYFLADKEVPADEAHQHIRPASPSSRQQVENEIILRDYKLCSIEQITMNGESYELTD
jgi:hypothetical protein